jgi:hypothetical protein
VTASIGDYDSAPDWEYGQLLQDTTGTGARLMLICWLYRVDYNWHESIFKGVAVATGTGEKPLTLGDVYEPYCGWWRPVDE